ncbi:CAP domain-containing protein [Aquimarina sp. U1-2]|uniref:CAP domain-containing protein n=1 Tax=Aquimarina sp. U1-2 TaxID=2823141 RepID=UPI001AECDCC8|nr:CAP domain-containing protein [Aquimarina sp. U1-2]MBP2833906.1 CAP domain-containing protein [Aquimarina sp. U1-2]
MKLPIRLCSIISIVFLLVSCSAEDVDDTLSNTDKEFYIPKVKPIETEILEQINAYRSSLQLSFLQPSSTIKSQAYLHTMYMVESNTMSHDYFHTRRNYLVDSEGATKVGENVGYGYSSAAAVVDAWLKSEGHRRTIEGDFTHFDISVEQNSEGVLYFTNIFMKN